MSRIPTHPGAVLRADVFPALNMPKTKIARALGISRSMLYAILAEDVPITPNIALRLGKFLGNGPELDSAAGNGNQSPFFSGGRAFAARRAADR